MDNGSHEEGENRLRPVRSAEASSDCLPREGMEDNHGQEQVMSDHEPTTAARRKAPPRRQSRLRSQCVEYVPPEGSTETQPPYGSPEIARWMLIDGRRIQRHASYGEAWRAARPRIVMAAVWMLVGLAGILCAACAFFGGALVLLTVLISPPAALIAVTIMGLAVMLAAGVRSVWPSRVAEPLPTVRPRYDLSDDEFYLSLVIVISVLATVGLLALFTVGR